MSVPYHIVNIIELTVLRYALSIFTHSTRLTAVVENNILQKTKMKPIQLRSNASGDLLPLSRIVNKYICMQHVVPVSGRRRLTPRCGRHRREERIHAHRVVVGGIGAVPSEEITSGDHSRQLRLIETAHKEFVHSMGKTGTTSCQSITKSKRSAEPKVIQKIISRILGGRQELICIISKG